MNTDRETVLSYDMVAAEYAAEVAAMPEWVATKIDVFVTALGSKDSLPLRPECSNIIPLLCLGSH